ncbi:MAG: hypothetical protein K2G15_02435 [Muribaculaceae bacterium]|nr:hypothetical protein [Muribaculaceae bacterium]
MKKELTEILEQLRDLTAKVEALIDNIEDNPAPLEVIEEELEEELEELEELEDIPQDIVLDSNPSEVPEVSDNSDFSDVAKPSSYSTPPLPAAIKFSLNDRFRFQRAIFGNSPERMANAMTAISAMTTADEVYAYLTNVLNRDVNDPDVEDFFREVTLRFSDHKPLII